MPIIDLPAKPQELGEILLRLSGALADVCECAYSPAYCKCIKVETVRVNTKGFEVRANNRTFYIGVSLEYASPK